VNLGSFYAVFEAAAPCVCGSAEQYPLLLAAITDAWKVRALVVPCSVGWLGGG